MGALRAVCVAEGEITLSRLCTSNLPDVNFCRRHHRAPTLSTSITQAVPTDSFTPSLTCVFIYIATLTTLQVSLESRGPESFKTPKGVCVPFGSMELALASLPPGEQQRFDSLLSASESAGIAELEGIAGEMQVHVLLCFCSVLLT